MNSVLSFKSDQRTLTGPEAAAAKKYLTLSGSGVLGTRPVHWANNKEATGHLHFYKQIYM